MIQGNLPARLRELLSSDDVWWKHAQRSSMKQFLSHYKLHDSTLLNLEFGLHGSARAVIRFDMMGTNPFVKKPNFPVEQPYYGQPYLFINFPNVHQILSDHAEKFVDSIIQGAGTKLINAEQRELWLELFLKLDIKEDAGHFLLDENLHCTTFEGIQGNSVYLFHNEPTYFLCVEDDGTILKLPDLELGDKPEN